MSIEDEVIAEERKSRPSDVCHVCVFIEEQGDTAPQWRAVISNKNRVVAAIARTMIQHGYPYSDGSTAEAIGKHRKAGHP